MTSRGAIYRRCLAGGDGTGGVGLEFEAFMLCCILDMLGNGRRCKQDSKAM